MLEKCLKTAHMLNLLAELLLQKSFSFQSGKFKMNYYWTLMFFSEM